MTLMNLPELYLCVIVTIETCFTIAMYRLMETKKQQTARKRAVTRFLSTLGVS